MRRSRVKTQAGAQAGFSLIEIMLALAVVAIGLIAVIGLIPRGVQASRDAADNTLAATIALDVFNSIRSQPFNNVINVGPGPLNLNTFPGPVTLNYDSSGNPTNALDYYRVIVTFQPQTGLAPPLGLPLSWVTATVLCPGKSSSPSTNVFATQIANYQN
jgi:uncharacterized protein (TIGR02598 family)